MKKDTTFVERLRPLFREQCITIVSVLTAIGMTIGVIVEAVILTSRGAVTPPKPSSSQGGVKEWVKKNKCITLVGYCCIAWCDWVYSVMASFSHWESSELVWK